MAPNHNQSQFDIHVTNSVLAIPAPFVINHHSTLGKQVILRMLVRFALLVSKGDEKKVPSDILLDIIRPDDTGKTSHNVH